MSYRLYIKDNLDAITSEELEAAIASLPQWRREKALRFKHRQGRLECAYSYLLLCQALREVYGITEQPSFSLGTHGKPHLQFSHQPAPPTVNCQLSIVNCQLSTVNCQLSTVNCQLSTVNCQLSTVNFNLSHCCSAIACVVSDQPVGVDVECVGRYSESLARHVLSPEEFALVASSPDPQIPFTRLWTQKEAVVKLTGRGIDDDLPHLLSTCHGVSLHTEDHLDKGFILSVASFSSHPSPSSAK